MIAAGTEETWLLARRTRSALESAKQEKRRALLRDYEKTVDADLGAEFDERIIAARTAESAARRVHEDELIAMGRENAKTMPAGVLVEYEYIRFSNGVKQLTGRKGRFEIRTRETPMPGNVSEYQWPEMGAQFIRILKKDGKPSTAFVRWSSVDRWIPEGTPL